MSAYQDALTSSIFIDRSDRGRVEIFGPDRAKFLHNLTTSDIKRLPVGQSVEAFVTSPQGKTLGFVIVHALKDRLLVRADAGAFVYALPHLDKYGVFDDVQIEDVSATTFEYHIAGPDAETLVLQNLGMLPEVGDGRVLRLGFQDDLLVLARESSYGTPGLTLIGPTHLASSARAVLFGQVLPVEPDLNSADALRIEAGTPVFLRDITIDNLPQEVARDDRAINFVKGCYLGQETVARLDALGHVNKILRGLRILGGEADVPAAGTAILFDGKPVGKITSSAYSDGWGCPVALGYVRTAHAGIGTELLVELGDKTTAAIVSAWPMRRDGMTDGQ